MKNNSNVKYAGFHLRAIAWIIDSVILGIPLQMFTKIIDEESTLFIILIIFTWWIYTSYSISKWYGTLGKRIIGLCVVTPAMERVSFKKATLRYIFSLLSYIPITLYIGFMDDIETMSDALVWILLVVSVAPIFMMLFQHRKQTLYDYFAETIVVERIDYKIEDDIVNQKEKTKINMVQKVIRFLVGLAIIIPVAYGVFYFTVMYIAFHGYGKSSDKPTTSMSKIVEYNNTKIDFYKSELEKASDEFIEAESIYDIFQGYAKRDLALNCIGFFIQKEGNKDWLDEMYKYKANARSKYANTEKRVKKAKKNEAYMGHHFYDYDLNIVHEVEEDVANMWDKNTNQNTCEKYMPVKTMYEIFIEKYIPKFDDENIHSRFGSKPQQREIDWYRILKEKRGDVFQKIQQEKEKIKKEEKRAEEERISMIRERREQRKIAQYQAEQENRTVLLTLQDILFQQDKDLEKINLLLNKVKNINLWIDGSPQNNLLYQAVQQNDLNASKILLARGANTVKTTKIIPLAVSDRVNREMFELILRDYLKPKNYSNINMLLIWAIEQKASDEKIQMILNHLGKVTNEYIYVVESAIKYCRDAKSIKLLLDREEKLKQNERLFELLNETSSRCSHKKEIYELFQRKAPEKEHFKSKFIRFKK